MSTTTNSTLPLDPARQYESRAWQQTTANVVCSTIAAILTLLRLYTRLFLIKKYFWEDLSLALALVRISLPPRTNSEC
jgi:hypothetical protein